MFGLQKEETKKNTNSIKKYTIIVSFSQEKTAALVSCIISGEMLVK